MKIRKVLEIDHETTRKLMIDSCDVWSNDGAIGYAQIALDNTDFTLEQRETFMQAFWDAMNEKSVDEAIDYAQHH